ncbi:MAG TPA: cobalamin biosynthesis protein CbiG [Rhodocyclaceae bacterium]|nr:cobalamin biosynthesis protein CbiG [Rhodocyclaceae bacterium]
MDRTRVAVGVGCDRGTPAETIATALQEALGRLPEPATIVHCASITLKRDESGLHEALAPYLHAGASLSFYPPEALAAIPVPSPSETVRRYTGTPSVAEAAALLAAGWRASTLAEHPGYPMLPVEKLRRCGSDGRNVTISLAYCYQPPEGTKPDGATRNASERDVYRSLCSEPR